MKLTGHVTRATSRIPQLKVTSLLRCDFRKAFQKEFWPGVFHHRYHEFDKLIADGMILLNQLEVDP